MLFLLYMTTEVTPTDVRIWFGWVPAYRRVVPMSALRRMKVTALMVTHREGVARRADNIIVLDQGNVVEAGTARKVIGAGGPFDQLWVSEDDLVLAGAGSRRAGGRSRNGNGGTPRRRKVQA